MPLTVDPRAVSGFAQAVGAYERGRPSYPADLLGAAARDAGLGASSTALDLAAGTGKLSRVLEGLVGRVIAVDPSRAMLARLGRELPGVDTLLGEAEAIPLPDGSCDAVFVGQAFHWFRTVPACREIARVLSPGGALVLVWNRACWAEQEHAWLEDFDALVEPIRRAGGAFPATDATWPGDLAATGLFTPLQRDATRHVHTVTVDDFIGLVASWSWIANLADTARTALLDEIRRLHAGTSELALLYRTEVSWARKA